MPSNNLPFPPTVAQWLTSAESILQTVQIPSAQLDAELLLCYAHGKERTWLRAHSEDILPQHIIDIANACINLRKQHVPIAYIVGKKDFYGRMFSVTPKVLVPRPESEACISLLDSVPSEHRIHIIDIGTGSGCLAITAALEYPASTIAACDISAPALAVARKNSDTHNATVAFYESNLLDSVPNFTTPTTVIANLPYVAKGAKTSMSTRHEPQCALYSDRDGLDHSLRLLDQLQVRQYCKAVIFETDEDQHDILNVEAKKRGFTHAQTLGLASLFIRE